MDKMEKRRAFWLIWMIIGCMLNINGNPHIWWCIVFLPVVLPCCHESQCAYAAAADLLKKASE